MTVESISKLDAATRQLDLAIVLHFRDADPFGVHTLAGAAHLILSDLTRRSNNAPLIPHKSEDVLAGGCIKARNFLKHADKDPVAVLTFDTDFSGFLIYDAIGMCLRLASKLTTPQGVFLAWLSTKYPTVNLLGDIAKETIDKLRELFPELVSRNTHKKVFLTCLEAQTSP